MGKKSTIIGILLFLVSFSNLFSQGKLSGYMFGDYYYVISHHNTKIEGKNGFWMRRIYFTYDHILSKNFSLRLRMEYASPGDFKTKAKIVPFVKDAYLKYNLSNHSIIFGISPTPTWEVVEHAWGYRSVEKTPLDLQKFGHSRDFGIAIKGSLDKAKKFKYHFMFANGEGVKSETNKQKKLMFSLGYYPTERIIFEVYTDWAPGEGKTGFYTLQGFIGYKDKNFKIGMQFAEQIREQGENRKSLNYEIGSVFFTYQINEKAALLARFDKMFDPNPAGEKISYIPFDSRAKSNLLIIGIDFKPHKLVHIIPNIEYVFYDETNGYKPDPDFYFKMTLYYKF